MPPFGPTSRSDLIRYLKKLGYEGPYSGGKHQFMSLGNFSLRIPNPHKSDIGKELLLRILKQANISKQDWEKL